MLRFEYRRAIGHAWYMHPVFIMYSALIYLVDLIYVIAYGSNIDEDKKKMMTALAVIDGVVLFFSLLLGMLVITFTEDNHAERRNYFTVDPSMRQGLMTEENEVGRSQSRTSSMLYGSQDGAERPKKRIIITANVSQKMIIDTKNSDRVMFEIVTKEKGVNIGKTKRTYQNFRSLDDTLRTKYTRQIQRGQLKKRDLPEAKNLSNTIALSQLREQLDQYL